MVRKNKKHSKDLLKVLITGLAFVLFCLFLILFSRSRRVQEMEEIINQEVLLIQSLFMDASIDELLQSREPQLLGDILQIDADWQAGRVNVLVEELSTNEIAQHLLGFQESHPEFHEIFVTDAQGANLAMTNKTSDYYQADESWWFNAFNNGEGAIGNEAIEFDESAQNWGIPIYFPLYDENSEIIGIAKAVLSIDVF
jgi:hypothetical protein